jgi:hypothetical protein
VPTPAGGDGYVFEKGMLALGQRRGYADVFMRGHFAWENKAPGKPLEGALKQLLNYAQALDNPPLLIVSDRLRIEVHTRFTGTPSECHVVMLDQLGDPAKRELLRRCFSNPKSFKPARTIRQITEEAANAFATTAERLREAGIAARYERIAVPRPHSVARRLREAAECTHADQARQRAPRLARPRPRSARRRCGHRLRMARLRAADAR